MKKLIKIFTVLFAMTMLFSCSNGTSVSETLTDILNKTSADVDLGGASYNEDAIISTKKKISNADFGGRTLTVNASGVVLDNVRNVNIVASEKIGAGDLEIKNSNTNSVTILGGGKNSIHLSNSIVVNLDVAKNSVRIVLEGSSTIEAVKVTAKGTTFKSDGDSVISNFSVEAGVDTVNISGGSIKNISLKTDGTSAAPSITVKGKVKIEAVASLNIVTNEKASAKIVISAEAKADGFEAPEGVDISDMEETDEDDDDPDSETPDEDIDTDKPFEDGEVSDNPKITEAFNLLFDGNYDAAIEKFREAYNEKKNDETKLYYALAEIATISTDESVADLLKNNFGFKNYPNKLNTLFSDEWFETTPYVGYRFVYTAEPTNIPENGSYNIFVRGNGIPTSSGYNMMMNNKKTYHFIVGDDGDIRSSWGYIEDFTPDTNGNYFVNFNSLPENSRNDESIQSALFTLEYRRKPYLGDDSIGLPFKVPEWLKETDSYKETLFNSIETASTNSLAFFASLVDCNPNGFNEAIDKANNIFGQKYNNAKNLIASLSQNSIEVPEKVIERLNLSSILGEDENIYIGKAEANVLVAAIDIIRATLKYISSYDLSLDSDKLKPAFNFYINGDYLRLLFSEAITSSTLTVRSQNTMNESKAMFKEAFEMALTSYNFIVKNSTYPQAVKDIIEENCHVWFEGVESLVNALKNNGVFYIPTSWQPASWPVSAENALFGIDMGKLFTSGFSDVVKHSRNGGVLFYVVMDSRGRDYLSTEYFDLANYNNSLWELADSLSKSNSNYQGGTLVETLVFDLNKIYALLPGFESVFSDLATEDNFFLDMARATIIPTPNND